MSEGVIDEEWTAARALGRAVRAAREGAGLNQTAFTAATGFPLTTLRSIEKARRPSRWTSTLDALDQAMTAAGVTNWPGWRVVQSHPHVDEPVTIELLEARLAELAAHPANNNHRELVALSARLDANDLAFVTALARWLAMRAN